MHKIVVIILNYKLKDLTIKCVNSVIGSSYKNLKIIVVDNSKENDLKESLRKKNNVIYVQTEENLGFCGGNNLGIKLALENEADYIFILNPDTTIKKDTISKLLKKAILYNAGILSPKIYFSDSNIIWYAGGKFDISNVLGTHEGVDEEDKSQFNLDKEVDFATGAAMFVPTKVFKEIGLFDERYFLYYEDSDFCFRAKKAGFKVMYIFDSVIYHENAKSTGLGSNIQDYYITRNRMLFASKFLTLRTQFALIREVLRNIRITSRRKALRDYLLGRFGKGSI